MRIVLKKSNIQGPYILMPHSISGIYSMYFANTYPEEVKAIIGIDPTLPHALKYFGETSPTMPKYFSYLAPTGIARLALYIKDRKSVVKGKSVKIKSDMIDKKKQ